MTQEQIEQLEKELWDAADRVSEKTINVYQHIYTNYPGENNSAYTKR